MKYKLNILTSKSRGAHTHNLSMIEYKYQVAIRSTVMSSKALR